jgi:putative acetyltransferase
VIIEAHSSAHVASIRELFSEYAASLGLDLEYEHFARELATLPGDYVPPAGVLLLAIEQDRALGCVGVRPLEPGSCELKRLYVRPEARGTGLGRELTEQAIAFGRGAGYHVMRLDTLPSMASARALYRALGFHEIAPYRYNPVPGTAFLELTLA